MKKLLFLLVGFAAELYSYDSDIHQQLTFLAAKQYSKCAEVRPGLYRPSALDVRYLVRANVAQADAGFYEGKVSACQFFYRYHLPQAAEKLRYVASRDRSVLDTQASWFTGF